MPAGRFKPVYNQKPLKPSPKPKLGPQAAGGAVLRRQTFQPENRKQQARLSAGVKQARQTLNYAHGNELRDKLAKKANYKELSLPLQQRVSPRRYYTLMEHRELAKGPIKKAGAPGFLGGKHGLVAKTIHDVGEMAYYAPGGTVALGKAVYKDVAPPVLGGSPRDAPLLGNTRKIGAVVGKQTLESIRHPERHPGYTLANLLAGAGAVAGTASRLGAASEALRAGEGVGAAITRPGFKGGSLLHRKAPGEINLPGGVQALEYDNPLMRPLQRARLKRVSKIVTGEKKPFPKPAVLERHFGAQNVIGREARAREIVQSDVANARRVATHERLKGLSPEQHTAMRVVDVEGRHALRHPEETIARHVSKHEQVALESEARAAKVAKLLEERGGKWKDTTKNRARDRIVAEQNNATLNREIAKDLQKALPALKAQGPDFHAALQSTRNLTKQDEKQLRDAGLLSGESAYASRAAIAHFYGREKGVAPRGSTYFPTGPQFKFPTKSGRGGPVSRAAGAFGLGPGKPSSYLQGTLRHRTGEGSRYGVVERPGEAQVSRSSGVGRLASVDRSYKGLMQLSTPRRRSEFDIEIRHGGISPEQRQRVASEVAHAATGDATALGRLKDLLKPLPGERSRYVDSRYLKEFASSARGLKGAATVNRPIRFGGVYARPAYVFTNRPQNFLMRHLAQGITTHRPIHATVKTIRKELGPEVSAVLDALGGETRTAAYNPTRNVGHYERMVTDWIQARTDKNERFLAVLARAHEKGYRSMEDLKRLATSRPDAKIENDRVSIGRRSRKDMVDFSVTPGERTLSDFIYFYPWLSRGSAWSGRFAAQHPIKTAALGSLAPTGAQEQRKALGHVPGWMKGFIPTGHGGVINPASINTFETPAQIGSTLLNPSGPQARSFGEEFGTPFLQGLTTKPSDIPKRLLQQGTAPGLLLQRLGILGKAPKTFPDTGWKQALGPFVAGGLYPRRADLSVVKTQAYKEMPPEQRRKLKANDFRDTALKTWKQAGVLDDPKAASQALDSSLRLYTKRYTAYDKAGAQDQQSRFKVDVDLLASMGKLTSEQKAQALSWAKTATDSKLSSERAKIAAVYFGSKLVNAANADLKKRGIKVSLPR